MLLLVFLPNLGMGGSEAIPPPELAISGKFRIEFPAEDRSIVFSNEDRDIVFPAENRRIEL